jgi:hypothetical protein
MKKVVNNLITLQGLDNRLNTLKLQKGDLPILIEDLRGNLEGKKSLSQGYQEKTGKLQSDRRMFEKEIEASKNQLKKYEEQLYKVQNNKEYDAISLEIDTKKIEIENLENKIIQTLEDEEALKKEIESLSEEVSQLDKQLKENRQELEEIDVQTQEEEKRLLKDRERIAAEIEERFLRQYDRIRMAKNGLAVVPIRRSSCGGCFSTIPAQRIVQIREMDRLYTCEYCGRIMVWDGEEE